MLNITNLDYSFNNCYNLTNINNISNIGSITSDVTALSCLSNVELITGITINAMLSNFSCNGISGALNKLSYLRLLNPNSPFDNLDGQQFTVDITYTSLSDVVINQVFTDLPTVSNGQVIGITGSIGTNTCDQTIATNKGWTVQK
jgi:hypothetical protein